MQKTQVGKKILLGMFLAAYPISASLAQTKPLTPTPAQAASSAAPSPAGAVTTSAPLLSSPFLSSAAKERLKRDSLATVQAYNLVKIGDDFAQRGDWQNAQNQYEQALVLSPNFGGLGHQLALYGLIAYCRATGNTAQGLNYSRQAIYYHGSAAEGFFENDTARLMQFALLLNKTGQSAEAISVYNRAAHLLDYRDSQYNGNMPTLKVLLPELAAEPALLEQVQYTPEHLQALANTALAYEEISNNNKEAQAYMQEATKLYPNSAVTHYYLGETLPRGTLEQKAAYQKAAELGDDRTIAAAKERLTPFH